MTDNVAQVRIYREWNVPSRTDAELNQLKLAAAVLGGGKTSRLYQRLVFRDKLADSVSVEIEPQVLASLFELQVDVKRGVDRPASRRRSRTSGTASSPKGPSADELAREKTSTRAGFVRGLEKGQHAGFDPRRRPALLG